MKPYRTHEELLALNNQLLTAIKSRRTEVEKLLASCSSHWGYEDPVYRFYHQSMKVYGVQRATTDIVAALQSLMPDLPLNRWFQQIIEEGTGQQFQLEHNQDWLSHTRPIVEAFFHARFMLEMALRYADLPEAPTSLPSGWAALLYLYDIR
jgi:hypothetical protein